MIRFTQRVSCKRVLPRVLRRLCDNERGTISIVAAASLPFMLGFAGLGVDVSVWLRSMTSVQGAADVAVVSVIASVTAGEPKTRWQTEGFAVAAANGYTAGQNGVAVAVYNPPVSPSAFVGDVDHYQVVISAPQQQYLARVFGTSVLPPTVIGRAVALVKRNPTCLMALSGQAPPGGTLVTSGGAILKANNCAIYDDSPGAKSINTSGGGSITATDIKTVGNYNGNVVATDGAVQTGGSAVPDPYQYTRSIPPIPSFQPTSANNWSGHITNPTGVIAFNGDVTIQGATTLDPGIYIITKSLSVTNNNALSGTGVTIILTSPTPSTDTGTFNFSGTINLTAPKTGPTAGIALWADANLGNRCDQGNSCGVDQLTGSGSSNIIGAVYLPTHGVKFAGNQQAITTGCTQLVAYTISVTGTPTFNHNCDGVGILDAATTWGLVE